MFQHVPAAVLSIITSPDGQPELSLFAYRAVCCRAGKEEAPDDLVELFECQLECLVNVALQVCRNRCVLAHVPTIVRAPDVVEDRY